MKDETKEILDNPKILMLSYGNYISLDDYVKLKDYITNLQEELEDLRESDWAWHQLLKTQNKRMYRSKFLKEFQEEYGTNTYPDYDEIYKRYDKMKSRNEKAIEYIENVKTLNEEDRHTTMRWEYGVLFPELENILQGSEEE